MILLLILLIHSHGFFISNIITNSDRSSRDGESLTYLLVLLTTGEMQTWSLHTLCKANNPKISLVIHSSIRSFVATYPDEAY